MSDATKAMQQLHGLDIGGTAISVKIAAIAATDMAGLAGMNLPTLDDDEGEVFWHRAISLFYNGNVFPALPGPPFSLLFCGGLWKWFFKYLLPGLMVQQCINISDLDDGCR